MTIKEYSKKAYSTAIYKDNTNYPDIIYPILGLCGETGEVAEKIKKCIRDNKGEVTKEFKIEIIKELGDVLWYINAIAHDLGFNLEEVAQVNIDKLFSRKKRNKLQGSGDNR